MATAKAIEKGLSQNTLSLECQLFLNLEEDRRRDVMESLENLTLNQMLDMLSCYTYTAWSWQKSEASEDLLQLGATSFGDLEILKILFETSKSISPYNMHTLMRRACERGQLQVFQYLQVYSQDPSKFWIGNLPVLTPYHYNNFLGYSCSYGSPELVKYLLDFSTEFDGPLEPACYTGNLEIVKLLIHAIKTRTSGFKFETLCKALSKAGSRGHLEIIEFLIAEYRKQ